MKPALKQEVKSGLKIERSNKVKYNYKLTLTSQEYARLFNRILIDEPEGERPNKIESMEVILDSGQRYACEVGVEEGSA